MFLVDVMCVMCVCVCVCVMVDNNKKIVRRVSRRVRVSVK